MKKNKTFKTGDKVFAKVKGYPPWPALVESEKGKKYHVKFYGTGEIGNIKAEDLFYFNRHKKQLLKSLKRQDYNEAVEEIEKAIKQDGGDGDENPLDQSEANESINVSNSVERKKGKRKRSSADSVDLPPSKKSFSSDDTINQTSESVNDISVEPEISEENGKSENMDDKFNTKEENGKTKDDEVNNVVLKSDADAEAKEESEKSPEKNLEAKKDNAEKTKEVKQSKQKDISKEQEEEPNQDIKDERKSTEKSPKEKHANFDINDRSIVSETNLKNNILYADHVRQTEKYYKDLPAEPRADNKFQVFPVKLQSEKFAAIILHKKWPVKIFNEFERAIYDEEISKRVLSIRDEILGETRAVEDDEDLIPEINMTEEQIDAIIKKNIVENKQNRADRIKIETELLTLDAKIKLCLGLDNADPKKALEYLNEMDLLDVNQLMLMKHSHILEMVRRLRKYVGNTQEWNMQEELLENFKKDAEKVRTRAEEVYNKFRNLFTDIKRNMNFWDYFAEAVEKFKEDCKDLTEAEINVLCAPPKSRQAFMDKLNETEPLEFKEAIEDSDNSKETEKENSSEVANSEKAPETLTAEEEIIS